jgi:pimeloyl-ACP methyl ester carboxylesterase
MVRAPTANGVIDGGRDWRDSNVTTTLATWTEEVIELAGTSVQMVKGGTGEPLLVLHDEMGHPGWLRFHEALSQEFTLYIPSHPGFGGSKYLDWIMNMRDMAGWYLEALDDLAIGRVKMMGFSLGGWLAAEMATMNPDRFEKLILVDAMGIKPPVGEIYDMFLAVAKEFITDSIMNPEGTAEFERICPEEPDPAQVEYWEVAREQSCRLGWKPYMYYPALPHLLNRLKGLPTMVVWGSDDPIVPLSAGQLYRDSIPGSRLEVLNDCGHRPEVERPEAFVKVVSEFLSG